MTQTRPAVVSDSSTPIRYGNAASRPERHLTAVDHLTDRVQRFARLTHRVAA